MAHLTLLAVDHDPADHLTRFGIVLVHALEAGNRRCRACNGELLDVVSGLRCVGVELLYGVVCAEELLECGAGVALGLLARGERVGCLVVFVDGDGGVLLHDLREEHSLCTLLEGDEAATGVLEAVKLVLGEGVGRAVGIVEREPLVELGGHAVGREAAHHAVRR